MPLLCPAATSHPHRGTGVRTALGVLSPSTPTLAFAITCGEYSNVNCGAEATHTGARYTSGADVEPEPVVAARTRCV